MIFHNTRIGEPVDKRVGKWVARAGDGKKGELVVGRIVEYAGEWIGG